MKRFFVKLAILLLGKEIFEYFEEQAQKSQYKALPPLVGEVRAAFDEIPVSVWQSLKNEENKAKIKEVFQRRDHLLGTAAYNLGMEFLDKQINEDFLLAPFEKRAYELGKKIIEIYTNEEEDNKTELQTLIRNESREVLLASIDQLRYMATRSKTLADSERNFIKSALTMGKGIVTAWENEQHQ